MAIPVESPLSLVEAGTTPAAPPAGSLMFYAKSDGSLYVQSSAGVETKLPLTSAAPVPTSIPANGTFDMSTTNSQAVMGVPIFCDAGAAILGVAGAVLVGV